VHMKWGKHSWAC